MCMYIRIRVHMNTHAYTYVTHTCIPVVGGVVVPGELTGAGYNMKYVDEVHTHTMCTCTCKGYIQYGRDKR